MRRSLSIGDTFDAPPDTDPAPVPCEKCGAQCEDGWSQCPRCGYGEPDRDDAREAECEAER